MVRLLVSRQEYLSSGIHIGMKQKTKDMKRFIYKIRPDGLAILNLKKIDERIRIAAKFLSREKNILIVSRKPAIKEPLKNFSKIIGGKLILGRFMPGTLTNPNYRGFYEADIVLVNDPINDIRAIEEAVKARIPIVAICNTGHETKYIDLIIPANNKGKKAITLLYWLLAREILKERKLIKSNAEFKYTLEGFGKKEVKA